MEFYLLECKKNPILRQVLQCVVECKIVQGDIVVKMPEDHSDMSDELFRQIQKQASYEKDSSSKGPIFGHPDVHRMLKDVVEYEVALLDKGSLTELTFSKKLAKILLNKFEEVAQSRAVFILLKYLDHKESAVLVKKQIKENKKTLEKAAKNASN